MIDTPTDFNQQMCEPDRHRNGRRKPPVTRKGLTRKITLYPHSETTNGLDMDQPVDYYLRLNFYEDGIPCELFITCERNKALHDALGRMVSMALQRGAEPAAIHHQLRAIQGGPRAVFGYVSLPDFIAKWVVDATKEWAAQKNVDGNPDI